MPPKTKTAQQARSGEVQNQMQFLDGIEEAQSVPPTEPASSSRIGTSVVKGKEKAEDIDTDSEEGGAQLVRAKAQLEFAKSDEIREEKQTNEAAKGRMSIDDRRQKMAELRKKISNSASANRKDLLLDKRARQPGNYKDATNSRKLAKAEEILDERDALERGEDWDRIRNWRYTIEDEERWEEKLEAKAESRDKGLIDPNGLAARSYQRSLKGFKPDVKSYERLASTAKTLSSTASSSALIRKENQDQTVVRQDDVYAGVNNLDYGSHSPNDNAIDRVVSHLNMEADVRSKRSRKRPNVGADGNEDVTYINSKNAHFNRKIGRYYDKYTKEIRKNFERGTAL